MANGKTGSWRIAALMVLVGGAAILMALRLRASDNKKYKDTEELQKAGYWGTEETLAKHRLVLGKPMPKLELSNWIGKELTPEQMKGKILLIDYWATWCGPCVAAIPHNNELYRKYQSKGVEVIGACAGGGEEKMAEVAQAQKMEYPTARATPESAEAWAVQYWPTYALVDRNGIVRVIGIGPDSVVKAIDMLLAEQGDQATAPTATP